MSTDGSTPAMSPEEMRRHFLEQGYLCVPGVVPPERVAAMRRACDDFFAGRVARGQETSQGEAEMTTHEFLHIPELGPTPFLPEVTRVLRAVLGEGYTVYPNITMRAARYTTWHVDNGFVHKFHAGDASHLDDPEFLHAQCAVYLQDNEPGGAGGGLDVIPGSHLARIRVTDGSLAAGAEGKRAMSRPYSIPSRAGDLILFDGRAMHRGTPAAATAEQKKYAIFWGASRTHQPQVEGLLRYLAQRSDSLQRMGEGNDSSRAKETIGMFVQRYSDVATVRYPDSFPPSLVELVERQGIAMGAFDGEGGPVMHPPAALTAA